MLYAIKKYKIDLNGIDVDNYETLQSTTPSILPNQHHPTTLITVATYNWPVQPNAKANRIPPSVQQITACHHAGRIDHSNKRQLAKI